MGDLRQIHQSMLESVRALQPRPSSLLDIGSGSGVLTQALAASLPRATLTAVDTYRPIHTRHNITFVPGKAESLPFEDSSFDVVTASLSLHHWQNKQKGLREAFRVLKDDGRLIIGDPLLDGPLRSRFWGWLAQTIDRGNFTAPDELRGYLARAGFTEPVIRVVPGSLNPLYLITASKSGSTLERAR